MPAAHPWLPKEALQFGAHAAVAAGTAAPTDGWQEVAGTYEGVPGLFPCSVSMEQNEPLQGRPGDSVLHRD